MSREDTLKGGDSMETKESEKGLRLQAMLQEALKPIREKLETLEKDVESVKTSQEELKKMMRKNK